MSELKEVKPQYPDDNLPKIIKTNDIFGLFSTVSVAPTSHPKNFSDQILIFTNGATLRLYWYDATNSTWHYVTATA